MNKPVLLSVGATGRIGRHVVQLAHSAGYRVRALVRDPSRAQFPTGVGIIGGDLTETESLTEAARAVDAIVFTHGSDGGGKAGSRAVDYGGVRNILMALGESRPRVALMTAIGVTNRTGSYNQSTEAHDWKRRGERLLRASGLDYTIVRPGWFDYQSKGQERLVFLQGDRRQSGTPEDGVVSRRQIAHTLVTSLSLDSARKKTFELVAEMGPATADFDGPFSLLRSDGPSDIDAILDTENMPLDREPAAVLEDLNAIRRMRAGS